MEISFEQFTISFASIVVSQVIVEKTILSVFSVLFFVSKLQADYAVENAFPSLSFTDPVGIYHAGDGTDRLFVLEQPGTIKVFNTLTENVQTFLNITSIVESSKRIEFSFFTLLEF